MVKGFFKDNSQLGVWVWMVVVVDVTGNVCIGEGRYREIEDFVSFLEVFALDSCFNVFVQSQIVFIRFQVAVLVQLLELIFEFSIARGCYIFGVGEGFQDFGYEFLVFFGGRQSIFMEVKIVVFFCFIQVELEQVLL